jgi:hypothetical protein
LAFAGAALSLGFLTIGAWSGTASATAAAAHSKSTTTTSKSKSKSKSHPTTTTTTAPKSTTTPADTWLIKAIGAEAKLGSVRISGAIDQGKTDITLSLLVNGDGEGGGSFKQNGANIQLKRVGPLLYFNAPKSFWAANSTKAQTKAYGGKWIEVSALDSRFQSFDQFLNAGDLVQAVFEGHTTPLTLSKPTTLDGHKVVIVGDTVKVKGKTSSGKMYIAATGRPYVLKIVDKGPTESGTINFTDYGKAVSINTPPEPINLS